MKVFFNNDFTASRYAFDTTRKSAEVAKAIKDMPNVELADPSSFYETTEQLIRINHRFGYINAVKTGEPYFLAESQGFNWDEGIYQMALAHNAGLVAATSAVLVKGERTSGSLSSGLHHAAWDSGSGFCTFNGLAVAATGAVNIGAEKILILDFDAHCGGGTFSIINNSPIRSNVTQVDVSVSALDRYVTPKGGTDRLTILDHRPAFTDFDMKQTEYSDAIRTALDYAASIGPWDFVIYNAGMDPINDGISEATLMQRETDVADWIEANGYPAIFALAGGYTWGGITFEDLARLHGATASNFARVSTPAAI